MRSPMQILRRFGRDENGTVIAEAVIVLPMLLWAYLALFVYWDAYRSVNAAQKAAYTISDMISREKIGVTDNYIVGLRNVMRYLIDRDQTVNIRVTSIGCANSDVTDPKCSSEKGVFSVDWSRSPDNKKPRLTTATLQALKSHIPNMADGDRVVLVETEVFYKPAFNVGLSDEVLRQFIVTRPRFVPRTCLAGVTCS